jgi:hypothetical protein
MFAWCYFLFLKFPWGILNFKWKRSTS